jgi:hypothetical protein
MSEKSQLTYKAYSLISLDQCRRVDLSTPCWVIYWYYDLAVSVITGGKCPLASVSENYPVLSGRIMSDKPHFTNLSACGSIWCFKCLSVPAGGTGPCQFAYVTD